MSSDRRISHRLLRAAYRLFVRIVPESEFGDYIYSLSHFLFKHGRLPSDSKTFNDFLFHLKASDRIVDPLRVFVSDKEFLKLYVKAVIGDKYNVPTINLIRSPKDVYSYVFPEQCCIKPTHASGEIIVRRQGEVLDLDRMRRWFSLNYYRAGRERNYKTLVPKIIVEPLIFDGAPLNDYKLFCYRGSVKMIQVDIDRASDHKRMILDSNWNLLSFSIQYPGAGEKVERPRNLAEMIDVSETLSTGFDFVRIDLYSNGETCLVGEITNCHGNAGEHFVPASGEAIASALIFGNHDHD
jgi:hypothetical protein